MKCKDSNFWIGLGIGSVAGALAYNFSRTEKAKKLEDAICRAIHKASGEAKESSTLLKKKHCTLAPK